MICLRTFFLHTRNKSKTLTSPPFCACLVFYRKQCSVYGWNSTKGTRNVYYFLRILNFWSWKCVIHWSRECNFVDLFYFDKKKDQNLWSRDLTICNFYDPWSKKPWSHDFDLSKSYDHVILIWEKPWSLILRS